MTGEDRARAAAEFVRWLFGGGLAEEPVRPEPPRRHVPEGEARRMYGDSPAPSSALSPQDYLMAQVDRAVRKMRRDVAEALCSCGAAGTSALHEADCPGGRFWP